jgi:hypothetical protein
MQARDYAAEVVRISHQTETMLAMQAAAQQRAGRPAIASPAAPSDSAGTYRWTIISLLFVAALLLALLLRPFLAHHLGSPLWSGVLASLIGGAILAGLIWLLRRLLWPSRHST